MSSRRVKLVVAYDGVDFCGWAAQPGQRTVQSTLKEAVRQVSGEENEIVGASRTDSGAHAVGQVCHFDTTRPIPPERWAMAVNRWLPPDVAVVHAEFVDDEFHSRHWAKSRSYRYRIAVGAKDPHRARVVHAYGRSLNVLRMHEAAQAIVGEHDFEAFSQLMEPGDPTRRTVFRTQVKQVRDEVWLDVTASSFIRGMMRRLAGGLLEVGRGRRSIAEFGALLGPERDRMTWPVVLPAHGLCLRRVTHFRGPRASFKTEQFNNEDNDNE